MRKVRVLIVDDDRAMVKTISDILLISGFEPLQAYTGEEALETVKAEEVDCVLMDIKMPGINGDEALEMMKQHAPDLPVILMSAYPTEELEAQCRQRGASAVLTKPIDIELIVSLLGLLRKEDSILVVDDDPLFCRTLGDLLRTRGFAVTTETNPDNVLGHLQENYKLAVLLDLKLGTKSGLDILRAIREEYPSKPVVFITGYRDEMNDVIKQGLEIGAYTCLYKPVETEHLFSTIEEIGRKKIAFALQERLQE